MQLPNPTANHRLPDSPAVLSPGRRRLLLGGGALTLALPTAGCANSVVARNLDSAMSMLSSERKDSFDRKYALSLPYASIAVSFDAGPRALMVLGRYDGDALHWVSADRAVLVTRKGRIVRTVGLTGANLTETIFSNPDWVGTPIAAIPPGARAQRRIDLMPRRRMGLPVDAEFVTEGLETIRPLGADADVTVARLRERCQCRTLDWDFDNLYWVNPDSGAVLRSHQHVAPEMPLVVTEVIKPAA